MNYSDWIDKHVHSDPHVHVGFGTTLFWWYIVLILVLVLLGGVFSGLTLGLMGLDTVCQSGTSETDIRSISKSLV